MKLMRVENVDVDSCPKCAGVFLDANEGGVINVDLGMLFGFQARPVGKSKRLCPDHHRAMATFQVQTPTGAVDIERAECCGGVFLDAGEGYSISQANSAPAETLPSSPPPSTPPPSTTAAAPAPGVAAAGRVEGLACPACTAALTVRIFHEVNVDECGACEAFFLGSGEAELAGIDTVALFDDAPWGAPKAGPSALSCPACHVPMSVYKPALLGPSVDVHFAECCRGLWMKRSDEDHVRAASRISVNKRADAQYAAGEEVQPSAAVRTKEEVEAGRAAVERHRSAVVAGAQMTLYASLRDVQRR